MIKKPVQLSKQIGTHDILKDFGITQQELCNIKRKYRATFPPVVRLGFAGQQFYETKRIVSFFRRIGK